MSGGDTLLGHAIPLPRPDLYVAFAAVALFLPVVVILHRSLAWGLRTLANKAHDA